MQKNRPKQHVHNWKLIIEDSRNATEIPEEWAPFTNIGFTVRRFWGCVRGKKLKHRWEDVNPIGKYLTPFIVPAKSERIFIGASGFYPKEYEESF